MKVTDTAVDFHAALARLREGATLDAEESARVFHQIMTGQVPEDALADFLLVQAGRGPTVPEIVGAVKAMRGEMLSIAAPEGAIDLCGTGGDGHGTLNISTAVSFVAAGAGVAVAKHGNRSASSKSGAADILEALGVRIDLPPARAQQVLAETGISFLFAQVHHPAMRHVAGVRARLKRRTIFNLVGPLASPARVRRQLVGIFGREWLRPYIEAMRALGTERAMVVHGADGLDELTTTGPTYFTSLENGVITEGEIKPEDAGLERVSLEQLKGGTPRENADALLRLLEGEGFAGYRDIVLLNSAAALMVAGIVPSLRGGIDAARQSIRSGKALAKLNNLIEASNR